MSYEDWDVCVQSKAVGSWNLHVALPQGLDFFVMLASVNGIFGGRAQANYAAANTFQDALAYHRISLGEKAVSIDLGMMVGEGIIAEDTHLLSTLRRFGQFMDIRQDELLALMAYYCNPKLPILSYEQAQILIGIETVAAIRAKGIDVHHSFYRPMFRQLFRMDAKSASKPEGRDSSVVDYAAELMGAPTDDAAAQLVTSWFKAKIAQVLGLQDVDIDAERPVHTFGIDSLVAIDLKNWFAREIGADVQVFNLLGNHSLGEVATQAAQSSRFRAK
jgi:aryl carrier-like protein